MSVLPHHVSVHALSTGAITMPLRFFVTPIDDPNEMTILPSMSFLIVHIHPVTGKTTRVLFDLGIRSDTTKYSESMRQYLLAENETNNLEHISSALALGGLSTSDIDYVIFSHLHWDHLGVPADLESAQFILGAGGFSYLIAAGVNGSYERDLFPPGRTMELHHPGTHPIEAGGLPAAFAKEWKPMSAFPHTIDIFDDGSLFAVSAPGHMPGHLNLLCRRETGNYVYLAGDICHDVRIMTGDMDISIWPDADNPKLIRCAHVDKKAAVMTIKRVIDVEEGNTSLGVVEVVLSHDGVWEADARRRGRFWPGKL